MLFGLLTLLWILGHTLRPSAVLLTLTFKIQFICNDQLRF